MKELSTRPGICHGARSQREHARHREVMEVFWCSIRYGRSHLSEPNHECIQEVGT